MNPKQVAALLKSHGASDKSVALFLDNDVSGKTIVDGLSDEDSKVSRFCRMNWWWYHCSACMYPVMQTLRKIIFQKWFCGKETSRNFKIHFHRNDECCVQIHYQKFSVRIKATCSFSLISQEIGFTGAVQRRGIKDTLQLLIDEGSIGSMRRRKWSFILLSATINVNCHIIFASTLSYSTKLVWRQFLLYLIQDLLLWC